MKLIDCICLVLGGLSAGLCIATLWPGSPEFKSHAGMLLCIQVFPLVSGLLAYYKQKKEEPKP